MSTIYEGNTSLKFVICTGLVVLGLMFSQLGHAARYSTEVDLGVLDGGDVVPISGMTPKQDAYFFTLADDGKVSIMVDTDNPDKQIHNAKLWDESGSGGLLATGSDILAVDLIADNTYRIDITGGRGDYNGSIGVVVPIPAAAWLFGSALLGLLSLGRRQFGAKRL